MHSCCRAVPNDCAENRSIPRGYAGRRGVTRGSRITRGSRVTRCLSCRRAPVAPAAANVPKPVAKLADFPTKPIEIIIPYPPGGGYDAVARQLSTPLSRQLGQAVVVKNVPGGNQRIAARQFEQAPADGHTIMFVGDQNIYLSTFIDPAEGFDLTTWIWVAGIRQQLPYVGNGERTRSFKSIADVIAADKAGERIRMGNNGIGGFLPSNAVFAELIGLKNVVHVGGFGGTGDLVPAMVRGDLDLHVFQPISSTSQFVDSGDIRSLLVLKDARDPLIPDAPTPREAGLPNAGRSWSPWVARLSASRLSRTRRLTA